MDEIGGAELVGSFFDELPDSEDGRRSVLNPAMIEKIDNNEGKWVYVKLYETRSPPASMAWDINNDKKTIAPAEEYEAEAIKLSSGEWVLAVRKKGKQ